MKFIPLSVDQIRKKNNKIEFNSKKSLMQITQCNHYKILVYCFKKNKQYCTKLYVTLNVLIWQSHAEYFYLLHGAILTVSLHHANSIENADSLANSPKYTVLAIKPLCGGQGQKELTPICVWACVSHSKDTSTYTKHHRADSDQR